VTAAHGPTKQLDPTASRMRHTTSFRYLEIDFDLSPQTMMTLSTSSASCNKLVMMKGYEKHSFLFDIPGRRDSVYGEYRHDS
jgi:hypothetical protein